MKKSKIQKLNHFEQVALEKNSMKNIIGGVKTLFPIEPWRRLHLKNPFRKKPVKLTTGIRILSL